MDIDENIKERLIDLLVMNKIKYRPIATNTRQVPDIDEAVAFEFDVKGNDDSPSVVTLAIDEENYLTAFYDNAALESRKFSQLLPQLKRFAVNNGLKWNTENDDRIDHYLHKRKRAMKKEEDVLSEGYYPVSSQRSVGDHVPQVKIVIEHNRRMNEGEQRFRAINRIFVENTVGERILTPVRETSLARLFARVIAEGDLPHGQRWQHIETLCEEFQKIRGFVRATKNQVNEHALVGLGRSHYESMKETLSRLSNHRGYNQYFEDWQPALVEDGTAPDLSKLLESGEDPRIIEALPILHRLQKSQTKVQVSESRELKSLESWADSLVHDALFEDEQVDEMNRRGFLRTAGAGTAAAGLAGMGIHVAQDEARIESEEAIGAFKKAINAKNDKEALRAAIKLAGVSERVINQSAQLKQLVMLHAIEMSKQQPDNARIANLKQRIKTHADRVSMGHGEVVDKEGMPKEVREGKAVAKDEGIQDPLHDELYGRTSIPDDVVQATDKTEKISPVIGSKEKKHPFNGKLVGASESVHPAPSLNVNESSEVDDILQLARMINK